MPKITVNISDEEKQILQELKKSGLGKNQGEVLGLLIRNYNSPTKNSEEHNDPKISLNQFELSTEEKREVEDALTNSQSELNIIAKDGLLQRSRYLNSIAEKQAKLESMSDEEMQKATFKGAAKFKIEKAIETIINHNDNQPEKKNKVCLTKGIVFKLTGSNRQTINKYFDEREVMISDHNGKHKLTDRDNRKGKGFSFEQLLGLE